MADDFTPSQREAIDYRGTGIIVSAGAGSGKTRVLTERLMKYIVDEKADIDKFVVITFTQAAASELKARISKMLREKGLQRQEALLERAHIGTIHHFCSEILRENAHAVHINPDFRIVSDERAEEMKAAAIDKIMEQCYKDMDKNPEFGELVNSVGKGRTDEALVSLVLQLHEKMQCHPDPKKWAEKVIEELAIETDDAGNTIWGQEILSSAERKVKDYAEKFDALIVEMANDETVAEAYLPAISETAAGFREYARNLALGWNKAVNAPEIPYPGLKAIRNKAKNYDIELQEKVKAFNNKSKSAYKKVRSTISVPSEVLLDDMRGTASIMETLLSLVLKFDEVYSEDKRRLNYLDYNDLEHMASAFLSNHDISDRFTEIMVDEYQDVSRVQDYIFNKVSDNGRKLFMVGDIKQSIYRFRLADPDIFKDKCKDESVHSILLRENFRSGKNIISSINSIFENIMSDDLGDTDYKENSLVYGRKDDKDNSKDAQIIIINSGKYDSDRPTEDKLVLEARAVADRIARLHEEEGIEFEDIAILLRSAGKTGETFRKALKKRGIPVSSGQGGEFFESPEISSMVSILRVMDNPHNDIPLIAALRSAFFGFTPDELSNIRICDTNADFYDALKIHAKSNEKSAHFLETLSKLRKLSPDLSTDAMLRMIINETDAEIICALMEDGEHRMADLMQLVSLGVKFENDGYHGLHRFLIYLDRLKEKNTDISTAEKGKAVKIMSIHKSKGLEFKVVFVSNLQHQFNTNDSKENVLIHPELGLGPKVTDNVRKIQYPTLARNAIASRVDKEMLSEEMRLMYVALTRAEERLYLTACVDKPDEVKTKALNASLSEAKCPLTWMLAANALEVSVIDAPSKDDKTVVEEENGNDRKADNRYLEDFEYEYKYLDSVDVPSKVNATELKHLQEPEEGTESLIKQKRTRKIHTDGSHISASERGSATHKVLQLMDFDKDVESEIERLVAKKFISTREASAADRDAIIAFLASDTGRMVANSENVRREFEFMLLYDADELIGRGGNEKILLRGVVDCCIEQDDGIIIIDYKTDHVKTDEEIEERVKLYSPQLDIYGKSLNRIFAKPIKEKILYFMYSGKAVLLK